jgi:hypothetical protein
VRLDKNSNLYYGLVKAATTIAYCSLLWVTVRFFEHEHYFKLALMCGALSACWFVLTYIQSKRLFTTYFDVLSRLEFIVPFWIGVLLAIAAFIDSTFVTLRILAGGLIIGWLGLYVMYRLNRKHYMIQGHGPLPEGCWISPPAAVLQAGDLLLTSGRVAKNLRESVGHAEMVIELPDGSKRAFSSYMAKGTVLNPLEEVASATLEHGHYIALRLREPLSREQVAKAALIAQEMVAENIVWRDDVNEGRAQFIDALPLPIEWRKALIKRFKATGYDWLGLFMGRLADDHWTCIAACLELYKRLGIRTNRYGTGLLGFGTTLFDPIMPVRFLSDPAFRMLTDTDRDVVQAPSAVPLQS